MTKLKKNKMTNKKCYYNLFCNNSNCKFIHTSSYEFRMFFKEIIDKHKIADYYESDNKCFYPISCRNSKCTKKHLLNVELSQFIDNVITQKIDIKTAREMYNDIMESKTTETSRFDSIKSNLLNIVDEPEEIKETYTDEQLRSFFQEINNCQNNIEIVLSQQRHKDMEIQRLLHEKELQQHEIMSYRIKIEELMKAIIKLNNY